MPRMRIEGRDLVDLVLSWSIQEVLNVDLYKVQVLFYVTFLCSLFISSKDTLL